MERGAEYYAGRYDFKTFQTNEPEKVKQAVAYLKQTKTDRETVILDSMTEFWAALQKKWQATLLERNKQSRGNKIEYYDIQPKDWGLIKGDMKSFLLSLVSVDMNVIVTCREKDLYSENELLKKVGVTFDSDRTLPYLFDTVVRLEKVNGKYFSVVEKELSVVAENVQFLDKQTTQQEQEQQAPPQQQEQEASQTFGEPPF